MFLSIRSLNNTTQRVLHMEGLPHGRVVAFELMSIDGNIANAIYRVVIVPRGMEHRKGTIRRLAYASWCSCQ